MDVIDVLDVVVKGALVGGTLAAIVWAINYVYFKIIDFFKGVFKGD